MPGLPPPWSGVRRGAPRSATSQREYYASLLSAMLARVPLVSFRTEDGSVRPLAGLHLSAPEDFTYALLSAWAVVGDVLSFYQQQIAREGYLLTAREDFSVQALAALLGQPRRPGMAANTCLAFTIRPAATGTSPAANAHGSSAFPSPDSVTISPGGDTAVMSIPQKGAQPVVFETIEEIEARGEHNAIPPRTTTETRGLTIAPGATRIVLAGTSTRLQPGDALLLIPQAPSTGSADLGEFFFVLIDSVESNPKTNRTRVAWAPGLPLGGSPISVESGNLFAFLRTGALYGKQAPTWSSVPASTKARYSQSQGGVFSSAGAMDSPDWTTMNQGLVQPKVLDLVVSSTGTGFAATSQGIYRRLTADSSWSRAMTGLTQTSLDALHLDSEGILYAGSVRGGVFRSTDEAGTWQSLSIATQGPPKGNPATKKPERRWLGTAVAWLLHHLRGSKPPATPTSKSPSRPANTVVRALATDLNPARAPWSLYAGTDDGVYRRNEWAQTWELLNDGLVEPAKATSGVSHHRRSGTQDGKTPAIFALALDARTGLLLAGGKAGLFWRPLDEPWVSWDPATFDPPPLSSDGPPLIVHCLRVVNGSSNKVSHGLAATSLGLYYAGGTTSNWAKMPWKRIDLGPGPVPASVYSLAVLRDARSPGPGTGQGLLVLAATSAGLCRLIRKNKAWLATPVSSPPPSGDGTVNLVAGTPSGQWLVSRPFIEATETEWPDLSTLTPGKLDVTPALSASPLDSLAGSFVVLHQNSPASATALLRVGTATQAYRSDFMTAATVNRITLAENTSALTGFDVRQTSVYFQSTPVVPSIQEVPVFAPLLGQEIQLTGRLPNLRVGKKVSVSGQRASAAVAGTIAGASPTFQRQLGFRIPNSLADDLDIAWISSDLRAAFKANGVVVSQTATVEIWKPTMGWLVRNGDQLFVLERTSETAADLPADPSDPTETSPAPAATSIGVYSNALFEVLAYRVESQDPSAAQVWELRAATGETTVLSLPADQQLIVWQPAASTNERIAEIALLAQVTPGDGRTLCRLGSPLVSVYDPFQTVVCGNVAAATHGETVTDEVLGGGDHTQSFQSFGLRQPPLTFVTRGDGQGVQSTLRIEVKPRSIPKLEADGKVHRIQGIPWLEVPCLYGMGPNQRIHQYQPDPNGNPVVTFGDGQNGARLPTGNDNVLATYRKGLGTVGNVGAHQLKLLKKGTPGIKSVSNPAPAQGGEDEEPTETHRLRIPLTTRNLGRIVSLRDYEEYLRQDPRVEGASARRVQRARDELIVLSVLPKGELAPSAFSSLLESLRQAIEPIRASSTPFVLLGLELVFCRVEARVSPRSGEDGKAAVAHARQAFETAFPRAAARQGNGVARTAVMRAIQESLAVAGVIVEALHIDGSARTCEESIPARSVRWNPGLDRIEPAQLLLPSPHSVFTPMP